MAGVADKARFYLERSVPQLREWEEKEIFNKDEIRSIVQKRNDYEHRVLSPGSKPTLWSDYAHWERSLESLRSKRCQRLKIRHLNSAYAGQARVLSIYERGVSKHPNSPDLWREYLSYTDSVKAAKRWRKTMTNALRMMPNDPELWIMAGRRSAKNGDMPSARGFFMRGCRFCTKDGTLWTEYARCEMEWLEKVEKRKKRPGSDPLAIERKDRDDELIIEDSDEDEDEEGGAVLPRPSKEQAKVIDKQSAQQLANNPAMDGAIPIAIFDIARKQPFFNAEVAEQFFNVFTTFNGVPAQSRISEHVLDTMDREYAGHPATGNCHIRQPIIAVDHRTAEFARGLRESLGMLQTYLASTTDAEELKGKTATWVKEYLAIDGLDEGIRAVLEHTLKKVTQP